MSLINDALKKASGRPPASADLPSAAPIMQAAAGQQRGTPRAWMLSAGAVAIVIGGVFLLRKEPEPVHAKAAAAPPAAVEAKAAETAPSAANPVERAAATLQQVAARNAGAEQIAASVLQPAALAKAEPRPAPKPVPPAPPEFPEIKLQAIYFRMNSPTAVLNGKTLSPGEEIEGARLLSIHRTSVEIQFAGKKKTLEIN